MSNTEDQIVTEEAIWTAFCTLATLASLRLLDKGKNNNVPSPATRMRRRMWTSSRKYTYIHAMAALRILKESAESLTTARVMLRGDTMRGFQELESVEMRLGLAEQKFAMNTGENELWLGLEVDTQTTEEPYGITSACCQHH